MWVGDMAPTDQNSSRTLSHIHHLTQAIGGRGSCTQGEREAADYVARQMQALGVQRASLEEFRGAPSTYRPYTLALAAALLGTLGLWLVGGRVVMAAAAILSALGTWGMVAETDFSANWMRWLLPRASSQNVVGILDPSERVHHRIVLCAHLDTHRTPIFYSSRTWHALFSFLVAASFLSMVVGAGVFGIAAVVDWRAARWIGLATASMQLFALILCVHADFTPYSPGANDNASGVGVILSLVERLVGEPLIHTEVWLAFTGCEEAAAYGMVAFLDAHAATLGPDAIYVILDQVGLGHLMVLTADGLIVKRRTHHRALDLARRANSHLLGGSVSEHVGIAYTDAAVATKRGLIALTVDALPPPDSGDAMHWHQMTDTVDRLDPETLASAHDFVWQLLQVVERLPPSVEG